MDTQKCINCGKELPTEAVFCPYCMTKLIEPKTGEKIKQNKNTQNILIAVICIAISLVSVAVITVSVLSFLNSSEKQVVNTNKQIDYSGYVGYWTDKYGDMDTVYTTGGPYLNVIETKDNLIKFSFSYISSAPTNRVANIANITCKIENGVGNFEFGDDCWANKGTGTIKLLEDEVHIVTTVTERADTSWSIEGNFVLIADKTEPIYVDPLWAGTSFYAIDDKFGTPTAEKLNLGDSEVYTYGALAVTVDSFKGAIKTVQVDYNFALSGNDYCYGMDEFDGNSTYEDVVNSMGKPDIDKIKEKYISYQIDEDRRLDITFDNDLKVTLFSITDFSV